MTDEELAASKTRVADGEAIKTEIALLESMKRTIGEPGTAAVRFGFLPQLSPMAVLATIDSHYQVVCTPAAFPGLQFEMFQAIVAVLQKRIDEASERYQKL